jgi:hypothetical protein
MPFFLHNMTLCGEPNLGAYEVASRGKALLYVNKITLNFQGLAMKGRKNTTPAVPQAKPVTPGIYLLPGDSPGLCKPQPLTRRAARPPRCQTAALPGRRAARPPRCQAGRCALPGRRAARPPRRRAARQAAALPCMQAAALLFNARRMHA